MEENKSDVVEQSDNGALEGGAYEIIRKRLLALGDDLLGRIDSLNGRRKEVFGALESKVLRSDRITTANNCVPRDMVSVGNYLIFGYNVFIGLKKETKVADVLSVYEMKEERFEEVEAGFLKDKKFLRDFVDLYTYYKETRFAMFYRKDATLLMVFQTGKKATDIKVFKWVIDSDNKIKYVDNRSESEYSLPAQHDFEWSRATRDNYVKGKHPHISIEDRVFVETVGGDLTVKVEDNTESGEGIYSEDVEKKEQTLDDAEFHYSIMGSIILLKILPYQEKDYRYIIFDEKKTKALRVDDIGQCAVRLPDDDGLIFPGGYYLISEGYKRFSIDTAGMRFLRVIQSPNGEDYLYIFYNEESGEYIMLQYNLISKSVETPIRCNGMALYEDGKMVFFKADSEAKKSHAIQLWQTPFVFDVSFTTTDTGSYLSKVGNRELVKGIADMRMIYGMIQTEEIYLGLYHDIVKRCTETLDMHYWIEHEEAFSPKELVLEIQANANSAINEYEKVVQIRRSTAESLKEAEVGVDALVKEIRTITFDGIDRFVDTIAELQVKRGQVISLKDLRYVDLVRVEAMEKVIAGHSDDISSNCVAFLLRDDALKAFDEDIAWCERAIPELKKVSELNEVGERLEKLNHSLDLLNDLVNTLKIDDATQTARIIENISTVYSRVNQVRAVYKKQRKGLLSQEMMLEFRAQFTLIGQTVLNSIDQADTPEKCEDALTRIMIQIEELEGKFADYDQFIEQLTAKREEVYSTFNNKKVQLEEALNKKTNSLLSAANRILSGVTNRLSSLKSVEEINGYFASDRMVLKVRDIVEQLFKLGDSVKAEDITGRLKSAQQDGVRQLKDKLDLFADGDDIISLGNFKFTVNRQSFGLTSVQREGEMFYHLTGTEFFERIDNEQFAATKVFWGRDLVSENGEVYRASYLAYKLLLSIVDKGSPVSGRELEGQLKEESGKGLLETVRTFMSAFIDEGYEKGVHDQDCAKLLAALYPVYKEAGTLRFHPVTRAYGAIFWYAAADSEEKTNLKSRLGSLALLGQLSDRKVSNSRYVTQLDEMVRAFYKEFNWPVDESFLGQTAEYLFEQLLITVGREEAYFTINKQAHDLFKGFISFLELQKMLERFWELLDSVGEDRASRLSMIEDWLGHFLEGAGAEYNGDFLYEAAALLLHCSLAGGKVEVYKDLVNEINTACRVEGLLGEHDSMVDSTLDFDLSRFMARLFTFHNEEVPRYREYQELKHRLVAEKQEEMRLSTFEPRILTTFVRNKLIDEVYLHLVGTNLAKQMGAYGEQKRTDLMGLLLLISPPGYGKTTLMEYIANRLGLIFMKINGPAIGHQVTSLDPAEANNATAREEIEKLNLALEMGNNVMLYLDDIQHCNPEFLQKFISLCDAQRKIEGVYRGKTKTYDLRGKKFCVIMAGNPYTESGEKFRIPDMLANRADTYNLGDVLGGHEDVFKLSYLENCLTSNPVLNKLVTRSQHDVYQMIKVAKTGSSEGADFEAKYSMEELKEFVAVFEKLLVIQEVILKVNSLYIYSAGQDEDYREEPKFLLQGSYRNMNKMAEKVQPIMNEAELKQTIMDHYNDESQLLTGGAEFNLLRFKEMTSWASEEDKERMSYIRGTFKKNKALGGAKEGDAMGQIMGQLNLFNDQFSGVAEEFSQVARVVAEKLKG